LENLKICSEVYITGGPLKSGGEIGRKEVIAGIGKRDKSGWLVGY
jgi:hypothetical protein